MCRVLILDDEKRYAQSVAETLRRADEEVRYQTRIFTRADEAIEAARRAAEAGRPFEILLIDQRLEQEMDGIEVMQELRRISPDSDAVIFTGFDSPEDGLKAYEAGAFRYLPKIFDKKELLFILRLLRRQRKEQREQNWQIIFSQMTEAALQKDTFQQAAQVIVEHALRLGFQRAHLFWLPLREHSRRTDCLVGVTAAGQGCCQEFSGRLFPLRHSPYFLPKAERDAAFFRGDSLQQTGGSMRLGEFSLPVGEWAVLPIWTGPDYRGALTLDFGDADRLMAEHERRLLNLFARQISVILERARLYEQEARSRQEETIIRTIGQRITTRAALDDLLPLLEEVRQQVGTLMRVENFIIALRDEETRQIDFRLHYEGGERQERHWLADDQGLTGYLLRQNEVIFISENVKAYREALGIPLYGRQAQCWLGVPLRVSERVIGGVIVQDYERPHAYSERDKRLLMAVAEQIAGAIQISRLAEIERQDAERMRVLLRASVEMLRIASNSDHLWYTMLTIATASFGARFNRAVLFLADNGYERLIGQAGIGTEDGQKARRDWEEDEKRGYDFETFLKELDSGAVRRTDYDQIVPGLTIHLSPQDAFSQVMQTNRRQVVPAKEVHSRLPTDFNQHFSFAECAVLPLRAGNTPVGIVVADNKHDGKPIQEKMLDRLETLLNNAGLAWETLRQRHQREILLDTTHAILVEAARLPLSETLKRICQAARANFEADWVIIYPLKPGGNIYEFENANISYDGALRQPIQQVIKEKPRQKGIVARILRSGNGLLVVNDLAQEAHRPELEGLAEHSFIKREGVRALLGIAIRDERTSAPLGVLFLDYRVKHTFSELEIRQARSFANLAAIAIANARQVQEALGSAEQFKQREREISYRMLEAALASNTEEEVIKALASNTAEAVSLIDNQAQTALVLQSWQSASFEQEPQEIYQCYTVSADGALKISKIGARQQNYIGRAIQEKSPVFSRSRREVYVPVRLGEMSVFGVFLAVRREGQASPELASLLERFAQVSALALDNIRRQGHLVSVLDAAKVVAEPTDLASTFKAVMKTLRQVSPDLSVFTLWYVDPQNPAGPLKVGASFGVHESEVAPSWQEGERPQEVVRYVMNLSEPLWDSDINRSKLKGRFSNSQRIASVAAFPLVADKEKIGAMFFNYRKPHYFSREERTIFPLLAEIVAASIRDAGRLEKERKQRERLNAVLETTETITTVLDLPTILERVLYKLGQLFKRTALCVMIYDEDENCLEFARESLQFYPIDIPERAELRRLPLNGPSIACRVARFTLEKREMICENIADVAADRDYLPMRRATRAELCLSLVSSKGQLLGILALERPYSPGFEPDDVELAKMIARQLSLAIERAHQSDDLGFSSTVAAAYSWAADIAHDINREVGRIKNRAYLTEQQAEQPEKVRRYAQEITASADTLSLASSWKNPPPQVVLPLDETVEKHIREFAEPKNIVPEFEPGCPGIYVRLNPVAFQRVLRQLVRNAAQAMENTPDKKLIVRTRATPDGKAEIEIEDNGPGVEERLRAVIFRRPVTHKEPSPREDEHGGYGLLFTRQMVENMGGKIRLLPQRPNAGATFSIKLPIAPSP